ncbi:MAG: trypsin-like peptidase domain-containing protein [Ktedonobacterales bacterium]
MAIEMIDTAVAPTPTVADSGLGAVSSEVALVAERVRESVVQVRVDARGIGSGIIWSVGAPDADGQADAMVITNAHVVGAGHSETFTLRLADGREVTATLLAADPEHDLAALRVHAAELRPAEIGDSSTIRVGEFVIAVGNPFGREGAVTTGVVAAHAPADPDLDLEPTIPDSQQPSPAEAPNSGRGQRWGGGRSPFSRIELVQADVRLYPGNSGGPLTDARGRVIGVNAMVGGGLGFAIPSRTAQRFLAEASGSGERVYLGVQIQTVPFSPAHRQRFGLAQEVAPLVMGVEEGSPAEAAGILVGDVMLAVDGRSIQTGEQLVRLLNRAGAQSSVVGQLRTLSVLRGGERIEVSLTPAVRVAA